MKLIITEKPSVARDIARVLKVSTKHQGYIEGNGYVITWALGHLIELCQPDAYHEQYQKWTFTDLPIIPETFKKAVIAQSADQFEIVKKWCQTKDVKQVICATDAGREGELIFRLIYEETGCKAPMQRLWISSQTDQAIQEGFAGLKPGGDYDPLFHSALSRSEADWLVGINATRAYTIRYSRGHGVMSVGRVQTPVLKMIVDRYREHIRFDSKTFYEIFADVRHENGVFRAKWFSGDEDRLFDEVKAKELADQITAVKSGKILSVSEKEKVEKQPLLYDLTELQKDANLKFKYSADQTLKLMQDLYERHKLLTYPRTSSRYLSQDIAPKLPGLVRHLSVLSEYAGIVKEITDSNRSIAARMIDDSKVTDHHAIIPTDQKPDLTALSPEHRAIYDLVIRRFLAAFLPECLKHQTEIICGFGGHTFKSTGTVIKRMGWRALYAVADLEEPKPRPKKGAKAEKMEEETLLPKVSAKDPVDNAATELKKGQTKAPPLHTEASLLAAMETAGKAIEDEELRQAMKNCGLGTPATRAQILEKLIKVSYIVREKNKLLPTAKGEMIIDNIQDEALVSPELTGGWEKKLNDIAQRKFSREAFMEEIRNFTKDVIDHVQQSAGGTIRADQKIYGVCPKCETGKIIETPKAYSCSNWKTNGCRFVIWKELSGKALSEKQVETLLKKGETSVIKGFKNKAGNPFNASLKIQNGDVVFDFHKESLGKCPLCEGQIVETAKAYSCDQWRITQCAFAIWKKVANRTISLEEAQLLLEKGQTGILAGFVSRAGKPFDAALKLNGAKVEFQFS